MPTDLVQRSKSALAAMVERGQAASKRESARTVALTEKVYNVLGGLTAMSTAAVVGVMEARFRNKDKTPLSLGPVPAHLLVGTGLSITSFWMDPAGQVTAAAQGCHGAYGATIGRGWGNAWRAKASPAGKVAGDWEDSLDEAMDAEEADLIQTL